jgi:hypothetical protein
MGERVEENLGRPLAFSSIYVIQPAYFALDSFFGTIRQRKKKTIRPM